MATAHTKLLSDLQLILRAGRTQDAAALHALIGGILESYGLPPERDGMDADLDDVAGYYGQRGGRFEVLEESSGAIAGSCGVLPLTDGRCELRKLYLARELRGHGLGKLLLRRAMTWAKNHGFVEMELHSAAALKEAVALYEHFGFERTSPANARTRCELHFRLKLSAPMTAGAVS